MPRRSDAEPPSPPPPRGLLARLVRLVVRLAVLGAIGIAAAGVYVRVVTRPYRRARVADVDAAPVAIVLGASVYRNGEPSPQLEDRLATALALRRAGRVERVLVSGARRGAYDEAGPMRHWLVARGVPGDAIDADHAGFRTLDTMERAAHVFGVRRAVVCTQAFHLPRAVFLARRAGIDAVGVDADLDDGRVSPGDYLRESVATVVALADSYVLHRRPRQDF